MKDPKRINRILKLVKKIWLKKSYLRLGQLINNCDNGDIYYIEDDLLEERLKYVYKEK